ncbi:MAG TPA: DUF420 domain-containing protein [Blastocatellia bacterium]|nr:DUF420 domain-containing protein [Blastocatellia bacterium]
MAGLFSNDATAWSNGNLVLQCAMGIALLAGMFMAKKKNFRAHGICQTTVIILNLAAISLFMLPVYKRGVAPKALTNLGDAFYSVSSAHAIIGTVAELIGIYIVLRAGTNLLPKALRFKNYKTWMRAELIIWWIVIGLGIGTYGVWYVAPSHANHGDAEVASKQPPAKDEAKPINIEISNFAFSPKDITVPAGTTIVWLNKTGRHSVFADDDSFESPIMTAGEEYKHTFDKPGKISYYCSIHGSAGGHDMAGTITVEPKK